MSKSKTSSKFWINFQIFYSNCFEVYYFDMDWPIKLKILITCVKFPVHYNEREHSTLIVEGSDVHSTPIRQQCPPRSEESLSCIYDCVQHTLKQKEVNPSTPKQWHQTDLRTVGFQSVRGVCLQCRLVCLRCNIERLKYPSSIFGLNQLAV